ncbi:MAG: hypothetical protein ABIY37_05935 [Devosia sp.]
MAAQVAAHASVVPDAGSSIARRDLLLVSAGAAAAMFFAANQPVRRTIALSAALTPAERVRALPKLHWDWTVELAVLHRFDTDRSGALALLWAALELDLDPSQTWRTKPALRLYDLYAAASDVTGRAALADLVRAQSTHPALLARATLWSDPSRAAHPRLWRTVGPDRQPLGIYLAQG